MLALELDRDLFIAFAAGRALTKIRVLHSEVGMVIQQDSYIDSEGITILFEHNVHDLYDSTVIDLTWDEVNMSHEDFKSYVHSLKQNNEI